MSAYGSVSIQADTKSSEFSPLVDGQTSEESIGPKTQLLIFVLILFNTLIIGGIGFLGFSTFREMQTIAQPFQALNGGGSSAPGTGPHSGTVSAVVKYASAVAENLRATVSSATTFFLFGDADSAIAGFLANLLRYDFASFGAAGQAWGNKMVQVLGNKNCTTLGRVYCNTTSPTDSWSSYEMQCPPGPNGIPGRKVWCDQQPAQYQWGPQIVSTSCDRIGCPLRDMATAGGAVAAVMNRVKQVILPTNATQGTVGPASFSTGIFRLDGMLTWIKSQFNLTAWASAATTCSAFATNGLALNWTGCYTYGVYNNQTNCWNANDGLIPFFNRTLELCNAMQGLGS